jgi:hypothetical protein
MACAEEVFGLRNELDRDVHQLLQKIVETPEPTPFALVCKLETCFCFEMIARIVESLLRRRLKTNPAAALVGPRQSGKTTLARPFSGVYFDLEQPADRLRLDHQWNELVASCRLIILDEAQAWPELFSRLRGAIDAGRRRSGRQRSYPSFATIYPAQASS